MKTIILLFVIATSLCECAASKADSILLGAYTYHLRAIDRDLNQENEMIAIEYHGYIAGRMINSFYDETYFAGKRFVIANYGDFELATTVGIDRGYKSCKPGRRVPSDNDSVICPIVVPQIIYTKYQVQPSIGLFGNALTLHAEVKF
ncbi:MAG: hypothetical protein V4440_08715 [Pseudomonadota bacterium]